MLEVFSFEVQGYGHGTEDSIGSLIQNVERVLVKPGWSALTHVSFKVSITTLSRDNVKTVRGATITTR